MPKKQSLSSLKKLAWDDFSKYIRTRDAKRDEALLDGEMAFCITCNKAYPAFGKGCLQAGHYIGGRNNQVLFDERLVHSQCYNCNVNLKGNYIPYRRKMVEMWGEELLTLMEDNHGMTKKYTAQDLIELREHYREKTRQLAN